MSKGNTQKEIFALARANACNKEKKGNKYHANALDIVACKIIRLFIRQINMGGGA